MPSGWPALPNDPPDSGPRLLTQAATILAREAARISEVLPSIPGLASGTPASPLPSLAAPIPSMPGVDIDRLRRQAHDLVETLLTTFSPKADATDRASLLSAAGAVSAGSSALVEVRVANEGPTGLDVSLYSSNFIADGGYDIPALRVTFAPRACSIPAKGQQVFQAHIDVPQQAPPGIYSGLVQAMGSKYLKAIISVEVK